VELDGSIRRTSQSRSLTMAAIASVFTIARVAEILGEDEDWLQEISIEMMPEDGIIAVYGIGDDYVPAFTDYGIENLKELVLIYKDQARRRSADKPETD
jgi:hypothetical protein